MRIIHALCLIIKGLDAEKTRLSLETHRLIDMFEKQYAEMFGKDNNETDL